MRWKLLPFLFLANLGLFGQSPVQMNHSSRFSIKHWNTSNGLAQNSVRDIIISKDGTIWLATLGGIVRFDGSDFTHINIGNTPSLHSNRFMNLYEDSKGIIWFNHETTGMTYLKDNEFHRFGKGTSYEYLNYNSILEDADGNYWLSSTGGIHHMVHDSIINVPLGDQYTDFSNLRSISDDLIVFGTGIPGYSKHQSIVLFDGENVINEYPIEVDGNWHLTKKENDQLWILQSDRIIKFSPDNSDTLYLPTYMTTPRNLIVQGNQMWLGTSTGLFLLFMEGQTIKNSIKVLDGIDVKCLIKDKDDGIWVGTEGSGLFMINKQQVTIWEVDDPNLQAVRQVCEDGKNGIWFTSSCQYLIHFDGQNFTNYSYDGVCFHALHYDKYNNRALASIWQHVVSLSTNGIDTLVSLPNATYDNRISAIMTDKNQSIWIGTNAGNIYQSHDGELKEYKTKPGNVVQIITQIENGEIWAGTDEGIVIINNGQQKMLTYSDGLSPGTIRCIYQDKDGIIWTGSYGGGLSRIEGNTITRINTLSGLSENTVSRIHEDDLGRLWMLGNLGLFMTSKKILNDYAQDNSQKIRCISLRSADGMEEGNGPGRIAQTPDGLTWWPTIGGIASINTNEFEVDSTDISVIIHSVKSTNTILPIVDNKVTLNQQQRDFEISHTGVHYHTPEKIKYKHKLVGYDKNWIEDGNKRSISYTNLSPGKYTLKIQAANPFNIWSNNIQKLTIVIQPKWWEKDWVRALGIVILVIFVIMLYRWRTANLIRRKKMLQKQIKLRTKQLEIKNRELELGHQQLIQTISELKQTQDQLIQSEKMASLGVLAAGVAHEINNPLNFIRGGLYSIFNMIEENNYISDPDLAHHKQTIDDGINRTTNIVKSLNQFSRGSHSMNETCHIHEIMDSCLVMLTSELKEKVEIIKDYGKDIPPVKGNVSNLYQVFINLIANASHSIKEKGYINVKTYRSENAVTIMVSDNGVGIPEENLSKIMDPFFTTKPPGEGTGLGLSITYEIIQNHKGSISVESTEGVGTIFTVILPTIS